MADHEVSEGRTPTWVPIVLGIQFLLTVIIFGMCIYIIHGVYLDTLGFVLFLCLLTWLLIAFNVCTLYVSSLKKFRFPYAGLATSALMVIFWLSAMGAAAALRASFRYSVTVLGCSSDGSAINAHTCEVAKRGLERRAAVAGPTGLAVMSAIAGLSALVLISYIGILAIEIMAWNANRAHTSPSGGSTIPQKEGEAGYEGYRMEQPVQQQQQQQQPQQPYYEAQPQQGYAQQPYQGAPTPSPAPQGTYVQQPAPQPYQGAPAPAPATYELGQNPQQPPQPQQGHPYSGAGY